MFPFSDPRFFNFNISLILVVYIISKVCFCLDTKTSYSELVLAVIIMVQLLNIETFTPKRQDCTGRTDCCFWFGSHNRCTWFSLFFFPSLFQEVGFFCICNSTGQSRRKRNSEEACLISPPPQYLPQLSLIPSAPSPSTLQQRDLGVTLPG